MSSLQGTFYPGAPQEQAEVSVEANDCDLMPDDSISQHDDGDDSDEEKELSTKQWLGLLADLEGQGLRILVVSSITMSALIAEQANAIRASHQADPANEEEILSSPGVVNSSPSHAALATPPDEETQAVPGPRKPDIELTDTHFQASESA
jgi:hypothetical protein